MPRDHLKAKERARRYRERKKIEKYGIAAAGRNMTGRHGNHAKGEHNPRWNANTRRSTSHGYVAVRVPPDHPHGWGPPRLRRLDDLASALALAEERWADAERHTPRENA